MAEIMINFDSGIENVKIDYGSNSVTHSESGYGSALDYEPGNDIVLTATLKTGYSLKDAVITKTDVGTITGTISGNVVTIPESDIQWDSSFAVNLSTQGEVTRKSYDLSTSSKWATLSSGNHNVQIVAKASGYRDSEKSAAAVVKKEYPSVTLKAGTYQFKENPVLPTEELNATMAFKTKLYGATDYSEFTSIKADSTGIDYINSTTGASASVYYNDQWATSTSQRVIVVENDVQVPSDFLTWFENATYVPLKAGTYQFIVDTSLSNVPSNIYVPFTSDGVTYFKIAFLTDGMHFVKTSDTADNTSLTVYSASSGWVDEKYRVITVTEDTFIYRAQYTWFTANANAYTPTYTLEAGTYKFIDNPVFSAQSDDITQMFADGISGYFLTSDNTYSDLTDIYQISVLSAPTGFASLSTYFASSSADDNLFNNFDGEEDNPQWTTYLNSTRFITSDTDKLRAITLSTAQSVSAEFYKWAITDGNLVKQTEPTGETWLLNEQLQEVDSKAYNQTYTANFLSNGTSYTSLRITGSAELGNTDLLPQLYFGADGYTLVKGATYWVNQAYRTITFSTPPTGDLLNWLQANGTKQGGSINATVIMEDSSVNTINLYDGQNNTGTLLKSTKTPFTETFAIHSGYMYTEIGNIVNGDTVHFGSSVPKAESMANGSIKISTDTTVYLIIERCLTGDTLITLANNSVKRIDELTLNDKVLSYNEQGELVADKILYTDANEHKIHTEYDIWTFDDGTILKTVHRHRFYNVEQKAMIYMNEWKLGEHARNLNGKDIALINHETVKEEVSHYTLFTEHQNYFANGLLSGNRWTKKLNI